MDKFNLDVSLVARLGGHAAPRTHRDHHLCFDSDGGEDCRKVQQGENDHQSTGDGVHQEWWWYVFDECVDFCKKKTELLTRQVFDGNVLYGGEIIGILTLLFRFLGYGFRLAMCSVNWMEAQEFAILVPDPIAFAPGEPL